MLRQWLKRLGVTIVVEVVYYSLTITKMKATKKHDSQQQTIQCVKLIKPTT